MKDKEKLGGCMMSCGCAGSRLEDGKAIVDLVKSKGKDHLPSATAHEITCECGETFTFTKVVMNCPHCGMTYGVTPCSSHDITKIKPAGIRYA